MSSNSPFDFEGLGSLLEAKTLDFFTISFLKEEEAFWIQVELFKGSCYPENLFFFFFFMTSWTKLIVLSLQDGFYVLVLPTCCLCILPIWTWMHPKWKIFDGDAGQESTCTEMEGYRAGCSNVTTIKEDLMGIPATIDTHCIDMKHWSSDSLHICFRILKMCPLLAVLLLLFQVERVTGLQTYNICI